ncbi:MAG: proprotein convertase P-domain-containing protein [Anaerolineae bacterium]
MPKTRLAGLILFALLFAIPVWASAPSTAPVGYTKTTTTLSSSTVPITIPLVPAVITDTITVAGLDPYLLDVDLTTFIPHTFPDDLDITLTSPSGTVVMITTDNGAGNDNVFNGTVWDDSAATPVISAAFANLVVQPTLIPEGAMGAFIGENPNGVWTLTVSDDLAGDGGSLDNWSLTITTLNSVPPQTVATVSSSNVPIAIPLFPTVITDTITVAGLQPYILDVNLTTFIRHTFPDDLDITLTSPSGTVVTLTTDNGAGNDNVFNGTVWDDSASTPVSEAIFFNLVVQPALIPEGAMGAFVGEDPNGVWTLTVNDDLAGDGGSLDNWLLDITTPDNPNAAVSIDDVTLTEGDTGTQNLNFTVTRTNNLGDFTVDYATGGGTAAAGSDYATTSGTLTFAAGGSLTQTISVPLNGDRIDEGNETFNVILSSLVVTNGAAAISDDTGVGTITDDDTAGVTIAESGGTTTTQESGTTDTFTVVLNSQPLSDVVINVTSANTGEVTIEAGSTPLTFTSVNWSTPQTVTVRGVDDLLDDGDQPVVVTVAVDDPLSDDGYDPLPDQTVTATNQDDDTPGVYLSTNTVNVSESGATGSFTITLGTAPTAPVTIGLVLTNGAPNGATIVSSLPSLTLAAGDIGPVTVTLGALDDSVQEALTHTDTLTVSVGSTDPLYNGLGAAFNGGSGANSNEVTVSITDNDIAGVHFTQSAGSTQVSESGITDTFTVVLNTAPTADVTLTLTPDAQCELNASGASTPVTLTFTSLNWNSAQIITVSAIDDATAEATPHPCTITLGASSSADANYNGAAGILDGVGIGLPGTLNAEIADNDTPGLSFTAATVTEGGSPAAYTVSLNTAPTGDVNVTLTSDAQCTVTSSTTLILNAGTPSAVVTVLAVDDTTIEAQHTCVITHTTSSTDANYNGLSVPHTVTVNDNDSDAGGASAPIAPTTFTLNDGTIVLVDVDATTILYPDGRILVVNGGRTSVLTSLITVFDSTGRPIIDLAQIVRQVPGIHRPVSAPTSLLNLTTATTIAGRRDTLTWTVTVTNTTGAPLNGLVVALSFDAAVNLSTTPSIGQIAGIGQVPFVAKRVQSGTTALTWTIGTLNAGQSAVLTLHGPVPTTLTGSSLTVTAALRGTAIAPETKSVTTTIVDQLPATGETPLVPPLALIGAVLVIGLIVVKMRRSA